MTPEPHHPGSARSVVDINDEIRDLWLSADGTLNPEQRRRYSELLAEYAAAVQARIIPAA